MRKRRINRRIIKWTYRNSPDYAFAAATGCALAIHGHQPDVIATLNALWAIYLREEFDKQNQPGSFLEFSRRCGGGAPTGPRRIESSSVFHGNVSESTESPALQPPARHPRRCTLNVSVRNPAWLSGFETSETFETLFLAEEKK